MQSNLAALNEKWRANWKWPSVPKHINIQFCANVGVVLRLSNVASFLGRQSYNLIIHYTAFFTNKLMIEQ